MDDILFQSKLSTMPKPIQKEIQNYLDYLLFKYRDKTTKKHPKAGCMQGTFKMSNDFDAPLDDFKEYTG